MDGNHTFIVRRSLAIAAAIVLGAPAAVGQAASTPNNNVADETLSPGQVIGVVGLHVQDSNGAGAGRLWDVLVDENGQPRAVVIDYGGMLGMGQRKIAIAWKAIRFVPGDAAHPIRLMLTRQQMGAVPDFTYGSGPITLGNGG